MDNEITQPLRIGDIAPVFDAVTTQGKIHFPVDYNGKWVILFSHPSDFTPVCTSEFLLRSNGQRIRRPELPAHRTFRRRFVQPHCLAAHHTG